MSIETIFGACIGFEYFPPELMEAVEEDAKWGFMINLLFIRISFIKR